MRIHPIVVLPVVAALTACTPTAPASITLDKYEQIQTGMTLEEVQALMGEPGEETSRMEIEGAPPTFSHMWKNANGSNVGITFQDNKVVSKVQFGLK